jgi:hypothetical protein
MTIVGVFRIVLSILGIGAFYWFLIKQRPRFYKTKNGKLVEVEQDKID